MRIYLVCNSGIIGDKLSEQFGEQHQLVSYSVYEDNLSAYDAILIVEPFIVKGQYLSISTIWKNYLARHYSSTKLIVAGFNENDEHKNYLNLLDINPQFDLERFIEDAPTVDDKWEITQLLNGYDQVIAKLQLFFTGHNHESIVDAISKIRPALNNAELTLYGSKKSGREKESFSVVWQEWLYPKRQFFQHFYSRWYNYKDYFNGLPFYHLIKQAKIEEFIENLSWVFSQPQDLDETELAEVEEKYRQLNAFSRIGDITNLFNLINRLYISPEIAWVILLIDDDPQFHKLMQETFPLFTFSGIFHEEDILQLRESEKFDLILLDLELKKGAGKYSGLDYIKRLKNLYPQTPLAIVTTHGERTIIDHAITEEGADFFFAKQEIDAEKWTSIIVKLIANKARYSLGDIILFNELPNWEDKPNILVVEDDETWYECYQQMTQEYHFVRAATIQKAKDILKTQSFDLILLDLIFKEDDKGVMGGISFLPYLKERYPNTPLFVVSIEKSIERQIEISKLGGVDKYLYKPNYDELKWLKIIKAGVEIKKQKDLLNAS